MTEIIVGIILFDLMGLSLELTIPVSTLFLKHCRFGFQSSEFNPRYLRLLVKLDKPSLFFRRFDVRFTVISPSIAFFSRNTIKLRAFCRNLSTVRFLKNSLA